MAKDDTMNDDLSIESILERIKSSSNINEAKSLCLFASSLFNGNQYLLIQRYIISIKERDFETSIQLFWNLFNNKFFKEYIVLVVLKFLENEIDNLEYYSFIKNKYTKQFYKIYFNDGSNSNSNNHADYNNNNNNNVNTTDKKTNNKLDEIINQLLSNLNSLSFYINEIDSLNKLFNPIQYYLNGSSGNGSVVTITNNINFMKILELIQSTCNYLNENENYEYSILLYLYFKTKFNNQINTILKNNQQQIKSEEINMKIKKFWFSGIKSLNLFKNKFISQIGQQAAPPPPPPPTGSLDSDDIEMNTMDGDNNEFHFTENELFLLPINRFCLPIIFYIEKEEFNKEFSDGGNETTTLESNITPPITPITPRTPIIPHQPTMGTINKLEIINSCWKYYICKGDDLTDGSIMEIQIFLQQFADSGKHLKKHQSHSISNFTINLLSNPDKARNDYFDRNSESANDSDDTQESNDSYEFEMHLGIYLLSSLLYISSWRYFKFLITGNSIIEKQNIGNGSGSGNGSSSSINSSIISIGSGTESTSSSSLSMIIHQVLYYSNVDDESSFDDEFPKIVFTQRQIDAIKHLTLCMECFNDLNQEPWIDDFKKILSTTWNNSKFYWLYNSLADSHYYYESYSISLKFYKDIKIMIKKLEPNTMIPIGTGKKVIFDPNEELWVNRLLLNIGMTNHSEIEDSIICLLEILIAISIPSTLIPSRHTFKTIKPYLTVFNEQEILFWCIDSLATCYERLGMVGEMTVLYQSYWEYYKPRFIQIINEIKGVGNDGGNGCGSSHQIPLSNLVKKDLQIGYFFPRFFDYIINIEMLEEFSYILNKGFKLDILQRNQTVSNNREMIDIIKRHITITTSNSNITVSILLKQFFNEELDHFLAKKENRERQNNGNNNGGGVGSSKNTTPLLTNSNSGRGSSSNLHDIEMNE